MVKKLRFDKDFFPCPVADDDELYPNGIFEFNITKMIKYIQENPDEFIFEAVAVSDFYKSSSINASHLDSVDVGKAVILAEISPGQYNLIDGNHRVAKAVKMGIKSMQAYKLSAGQHMKFLTTQRGYEAYIEFWNDKRKTLREG